MSSWSVKLGKAIGVLRHEGVVSVLSKSTRALGSIFHRAKPGDVLFVTSGGGAGASAMYRAFNQMEELELQGVRCSVADLDSLHLFSYAGKFKIFVLVRPLVNAKMKKFVEKLKSLNKEIIFETDDLLFDPQNLSQSDYLKNISVLEKPLYENGLGSEILNDSYVEACVTTTGFLAEKLRIRGKQVFVSTNKLSEKAVALAERLLSQKRKEDGEIRLGYFSGSKSHDKDFAEISDVLIGIFEKYPNVKLHIAGPLELAQKLEKFAERIVRLPFVSQEKHFEHINSVDINLAPLEKNNPFCEAKSEIKWIGAGILEIPTVASATQTFREAISDGTDGFVADTDEEWLEKLERLITDGELRRKMGESARKVVLEKYTTRNAQNEEYYNYLRVHIT